MSYIIDDKINTTDNLKLCINPRISRGLYWDIEGCYTTAGSLESYFSSLTKDIDVKINEDKETKTKTLVASFKLPGYGDDELKSVSYDKKTKLLTVKVKSENESVETIKSVLFKPYKGIIDSTSFKVESFNKGILLISANLKEEDNVVKIF